MGDPVVRTYKPLSVELGPGLLTCIFDGIQRPLKAIALSSGDVFIPRGVDVPALDRKQTYEFNPRKYKVLASRHAYISSSSECRCEDCRLVLDAIQVSMWSPLGWSIA